MESDKELCRCEVCEQQRRRVENPIQQSLFVSEVPFLAAGFLEDTHS